MGPPNLKAWPWFFCGFYLIYWYFRGMEVSPTVALGSHICHQQYICCWSNLPWSSNMYFGVVLLYPLIDVNLFNTPQYNGLVLLLEFLTCPSYDESLTKVQQHNVSTFRVASLIWSLVADRQRFVWYDCQMVLLNIASEVHFSDHPFSGVVDGFWTCGLK